MNRLEALRNIRLYGWYVTLKDPIFWGPVLIATLQHLGKMSLPEVYFCEAVVLLGFVLLEIPSGALADLIGRKWTIAIGSTLHLASIVWHTFMTSPFDVWGANLTWMVGATLCSGADKALLFDSLKVVGREHEFRRIHGAAFSRRLMLVAFASLAAGFLGKVHLRLPLALSIPLLVIATVATFFFVEPPATQRYSMRQHWEQMRDCSKVVWHSGKLLWLIFFGIALSVTTKAWFFSYNPYFELVELDVRYWGLIFFLASVIAWFFSRNAHAMERFMSEKTALILMVGLIAVPMLIMGLFVHVASPYAVLIQSAVRGFREPFFADFINRLIARNDQRATIISINSAFVGLSEFIILGLFGIILGFWSLPFCLLLLGLLTLTLGTIGVRWYDHVFG